VSVLWTAKSVSRKENSKLLVPKGEKAPDILEASHWVGSCNADR